VTQSPDYTSSASDAPTDFKTPPTSLEFIEGMEAEAKERKAQRKWALRQLADEARVLAKTSPGRPGVSGRDDQLIQSASRMGGLVNMGFLDGKDVHDDLRPAVQEWGDYDDDLARDKIDRCIDNAIRDDITLWREWHSYAEKSGIRGIRAETFRDGRNTGKPETDDETTDSEHDKRTRTETTDDDSKAFRLPDGHRATDTGNSNRLLEAANGRIRYVHAWGKWIVYLDGHWIVDEKDALVTEKAKHVAKKLFNLAAEVAATDPDAAKPIWAWALKSSTSSHIAAMIKLARGVPGLLVNHENLDADPWILNCANGTIDLRTGQLRDHDPDDLCTLQVPVDYDPHATAPLWETCLKCWQPDAEVRDYIQLRAGAGATGIPTETVDIDCGGGGNGKSKFHGAIQHVLGPYATVPHKSLLVSGRFEQHPTVVANLFRKRIAVASETKAAESLNDEQVKNLTGGDRLTGRRMREDPWEFWPTHTLIMFSNHKPTVQGRDEGIWRRLRLVPWTVTISEHERDEGLAVKLQAEAPGILKWVVDGAKRFHAAGGSLQPPEVVRVATAQYRSEEDVVGRFVSEVMEFYPQTFCYSYDIKNELESWCDEHDIDPVPRMNEIATALTEKGARNGGRHMVNRQRSTKWNGVCVTQKAGETP
jgi:putative DNA primase/helicase